MKLRAFIFDAEFTVRQLLTAIFERRGYEVHAYAQAFSCQECAGLNCADVIICDLVLREGSGVHFVMAQRNIGCMNGNLALMAGSWQRADREAAQQLGCQTFTKPFAPSELEQWLEVVEEKINPGRELSDYFQTHTLALADPPKKASSEKG